MPLFATACHCLPLLVTACHCLPLQALRRTTLCSAKDVVRLVMQNLYCRSAIGSCFFSTVISFATTSSMRRWFVSTTALKTSILAWTWRLGAFHFCIDVCLEVPLRVQETCGEWLKVLRLKTGDAWSCLIMFDTEITSGNYTSGGRMSRGCWALRPQWRKPWKLLESPWGRVKWLNHCPAETSQSIQRFPKVFLKS